MLDDSYARLGRSRNTSKLVIAGVLALATIGVAALLLAPASSKPLPAPLTQVSVEAVEFEAFLKTYNKQYESVEEHTRRKEVFKANAEYIRAHNALGKNWSLAVNKFADLTEAEFESLYLSKLEVPAPQELGTQKLADVYDNLPYSIDWREANAVTSVKDQGVCGGCYAFASAASIESALAIAGYDLMDLSTQQLVDCSWEYGNIGCGGGWMSNAYDYVIDNGITTWDNYPYAGVDQSCDSVAEANPAAYISGYIYLPYGSAASLVLASQFTPVTVAVEASWQFYSSGVITSGCGTNLNHAVLVVGYNFLSVTPYYIVKNSWGGDWGLSGYLQIGIQEGVGVCGIQTYPQLPLL